MNPDDITYEQLIKDVDELAQLAKANRRLGESYIISSNSKLIMSNAKNTSAIDSLTDKLKDFSREASRQTKELISLTEQTGKQTDKLIKLTWAIVGLTILMLVGLIIQLVK